MLTQSRTNSSSIRGKTAQWQVGVDKAAATPENKAKIAELSKKESFFICYQLR